MTDERPSIGLELKAFIGASIMTFGVGLLWSGINTYLFRNYRQSWMQFLPFSQVAYSVLHYAILFLLFIWFRRIVIKWNWLLFSFAGRATRFDYWVRFSIPSTIIAALAYAISLGAAGLMAGSTAGSPLIFYYLVAVATIWPALAVGAKRCHDRDKSGWFLLIWLIPIVGPIWLLIELGFLRGSVGKNTYGPDPLAA